MAVARVDISAGTNGRAGWTDRTDGNLYALVVHARAGATKTLITGRISHEWDSQSRTWEVRLNLMRRRRSL